MSCWTIREQTKWYLGAVLSYVASVHFFLLQDEFFPPLKKKKRSKNPKNLFDQKSGRKLYSILGGIYPIYGIT